MSGCYWKLGQTENVFSVDCKIRATGHKIFFVVIFTSNHFRRRIKRERRTHRRANREREREREIALSNPRSRRSDRHPRPLHATVSALFIPLWQKKTHPTPPTHSSLSPTQWTTHPWANRTAMSNPPLSWPSEQPIPPTHSSSSHSIVCFDLSLSVT